MESRNWAIGESVVVKVSDILTLDAGWWEETMEETALGKPLPCRLIHPPEPTMYDQVLRHLEMISRETKIPPKSQLDFGEVALATIAVCLRWGTYFAVLADRTKPIWPQTEQKEISMIGDEEMARINIEASAALAQWIELMRADDSHFRKMVKAAQTLPMLPPLLDERTNHKLYRTISFINSAQSRQNFFGMLKEQYGDGWLEQKRADIMLNPTRWLANGLINAYWRNKSGIEDIHAGEWEARPLLQRRITLMQEYTIVQKVAEGIVPSMHAIYGSRDRSRHLSRQRPHSSEDALPHAFGGRAVYGEAYYVGFRVGDQEIGLDPHGHRGMTGPVGYWHVNDIQTSLHQLLEAGAQVQQAIQDVGGGKLIASVKDADGNIIGLLQSP